MRLVTPRPATADRCRRRLLLFLFLRTASPVAAADPPERAGAPWFVEAGTGSGIDFRHRCGSAEKDWIYEVNGSGVALFDYDGDGDLDLFFVNCNAGNAGDADDARDGSPARSALYRNDGGWRFTDVSDAAGIEPDAGWGCGVAVADIENDGDLDLYVTRRGANRLYRNRGDGSFELVADSGADDGSWGAGASFADFDRDGLVDLYVANYVDLAADPPKPRGAASCEYKGLPIFCGPGGLEPAGDRLFINRGNGRFRDASREWGVLDAPPSYGLGTLVVDVQRDGYPDVIVANDTRANFCFLNEAGKRFREAGLFLGLAYNDYGVAQAGMGLAAGDIRGVGRDDIFVTNFEDDTNTLYLAEPGGELFVEGTFAAGLGGPSYAYLGWGTFFFDAEGDGDLDLFVANGHVAPQVDALGVGQGYAQRNQLFVNDGSGRFSELGERAGPGLAVVKSSRGAACGDLDGDGDPDVVVNDIDSAPTLLENRSEGAGWVELRLRGRRSNAAAVGARAALWCGGRRQERTVRSGTSFASQCELWPRFGLGTQRAVERIVVDWPSGLSEEFAGWTDGARVERRSLTEGEGRGLPPAARSREGGNQ